MVPLWACNPMEFETMRFAIITKYVGATNSKPSRMQASGGGHTSYSPYDHQKDPRGNHEEALRLFLNRFSVDAHSLDFRGGTTGKGDNYVAWVNIR